MFSRGGQILRQRRQPAMLLYEGWRGCAFGAELAIVKVD